MLGVDYDLSAALQERTRCTRAVVGVRASSRAANVIRTRIAVVSAGVGVVRVSATDGRAAAVIRANVGIVAADSAMLATERRIAGVGGASIAVVTTDGAVLATQRRIAAVSGAGVVVVAIQRCAALAAEGCVANFGAVAGLTVAAGRVVRLRRASLGRFVARVCRAAHAIIAGDRCPRHAGAGQALLGTIAELAIITLCVAGARAREAANFNVVDQEAGEIVHR